MINLNSINSKQINYKLKYKYIKNEKIKINNN